MLGCWPPVYDSADLSPFALFEFEPAEGIFFFRERVCAKCAALKTLRTKPLTFKTAEDRIFLKRKVIVNSTILLVVDLLPCCEENS